MDTQALYALRDVAGIPAHPAVFMILGVFTFALHILAVQVMLGASGLTIWGALSKDIHKRRLAQAMLGVAKVGVGVAVVIGVAPLLFVQVIYDPFWYTSNVLSAWWVIGFILILIVAYSLMYVFYGKNHHLQTEKTTCPGSMILSLVLMLVVGFIMHVLTKQMLSPDQWMQWYAPDGVIDARGTKLHDFNLFRFGFFISLSVMIIGGWLIAYRQYIKKRYSVNDYVTNTEDNEYLEWLKPLGKRLSIAGGLISFFLGLGWMMTLPATQANFGLTPWVLIAALMLILASFLPTLIGKRINKTVFAYGIWAVMAVAMIVIAVAREALRWNILFGDFGYNAMDYKINMDWYSTGLFFGTFLVLGGVTLSYYLIVAWKAGQSKGVYTPSPAISMLGNLSIGLMVLWILHFFILGFWIWLR